MNLDKGYIELTHETGWEKPIQAKIIKRFHGRVETYRFFAMWNTFDEALEYMKYKHSHYEIVVNQQCSIGI